MISKFSNGQINDKFFDHYKLSKQIFTSADTTPNKYQKSAYELSFIGAYKKILKVYDNNSGKTTENLEEEDSINFLNYKKVNAVESILKFYSNEKAIFINEAHHIPLHRKFVIDLLEGLYKNGYRYFGAETLNHEDALLNSRGYPLLSSGFYSAEPVYGNLIREAIKIGYSVFPYERQAYAELDSVGNITYYGMEKDRELEQAKNISQIFSNDPNAKVIVLAGYAHIFEDKETRIAGNKTMSVQFKEITNIDPITIDQVEMTEKSEIKYENPYYRMTDMAETSLFIDIDGNIFREPKLHEVVDVQIFHPRTKYINDRPDWKVFGNKKYIKISNDKIDLSPPFLVKAFNKKESPEAVPVDVLEITQKNQEIYLILPEGNYVLEIINHQEKQLKLDISVP